MWRNRVGWWVYVGWSCVCVVVLGLGPNPSCCLRCFGRGSLAVYQWVLGLAVEEVIFFTCCKYEMWNYVFCYRLWCWIWYQILDTLISTRCNCHFFGTTPIGYEWFEVVCGGIGLGSGCMLVGRAYVSWCWGWGLTLAAVWGVLGEDRWPSTGGF